MSIVFKLIGLWIIIFLVLIISIVFMKVLMPDNLGIRGFVGALILIIGIVFTTKIRKDGELAFPIYEDTGENPHQKRRIKKQINFNYEKPEPFTNKEIAIRLIYPLIILGLINLIFTSDFVLFIINIGIGLILPFVVLILNHKYNTIRFMIGAYQWGMLFLGGVTAVGLAINPN